MRLILTTLALSATCSGQVLDLSGGATIIPSIKGPGAPKQKCGPGVNQGVVYSRTDAGAAGATVYVCANTGVTAVWSWEGPFSPVTGPTTFQAGAGDGATAGSVVSFTAVRYYYNDTGKTVTVTALKCFTDNAGATTVDIKNAAGTSFLTAPITCSSTIASGTQSATVTLAAGDYFTATVSADGTSKQILWVVTGHT
jgi:hypothetical protein